MFPSRKPFILRLTRYAWALIALLAGPLAPAEDPPWEDVEMAAEPGAADRSSSDSSQALRRSFIPGSSGKDAKGASAFSLVIPSRSVKPASRADVEHPHVSKDLDGDTKMAGPGSAAGSNSSSISNSSSATAAALKPDPGARVLTDQAILDEIAVLTQGMDLSQPLRNCGRLSLALVDFLATGQSNGGPVSTEPVEDPPSSEWEYRTEQVQLKQEDGSMKTIELRVARYTQEGNEDGKYDTPTAGFRQTGKDRWAEHLDLASDLTKPIQVDWTMVPVWIARELERVDQVAGTLTASRVKVNEHADDAMHEIVFDAYRTDAGFRIRFLDAQDRQHPIRDHLEEVFDFVSSPEPKAIHADSFAPRVALKVSLRRKLAVADGKATPAAAPWAVSGQGRKRKAEEPAEGLAKKPKLPNPAPVLDQEGWNRAAAALAEHAREHGIPGPTSIVQVAGVTLGPWAGYQRAAYKEGTLPPAQIAILEAIPGWYWVWRASAPWDLIAAALAEHAREHGIPNQKSTVRGAGVKLGMWANNQRMAYKAGTLSPARIATLEAIPGWYWPGTSGRPKRAEEKPGC